MADRILLAMEGRERMRRPRQLSVELTSTASLEYISSIILPSGRLTHLVFSWKTFSRRSRSPEASASRFGGGISWCVLGTSAREVSFCSGRYTYNQPRSLYKQKSVGSRRTLGSFIKPRVCTKTTCCTNLMQQTRTPAVAESHMRSIFDLMAAMFSHVGASFGLTILEKMKHIRYHSIR